MGIAERAAHDGWTFGLGCTAVADVDALSGRVWRKGRDVEKCGMTLVMSMFASWLPRIPTPGPSFRCRRQGRETATGGIGVWCIEGYE